MVIRRNTFFLSLFAILLIAFAAGKLWWLTHAKKTTGVFVYQGRGNALEQFRQIDYDAYYRLGDDTIRFKGEGNPRIKQNTVVPVLYQPANPQDARVYTFISFWGKTVTNGGILFAVLLVIFLHPAIVPRKSKLHLSLRSPFIQLV